MMTVIDDEELSALMGMVDALGDLRMLSDKYQLLASVDDEQSGMQVSQTMHRVWYELGRFEHLADKTKYN